MHLDHTLQVSERFKQLLLEILNENDTSLGSNDYACTFMNDYAFEIALEFGWSFNVIGIKELQIVEVKGVAMTGFGVSNDSIVFN